MNSKIYGLWYLYVLITIVHGIRDQPTWLSSTGSTGSPFREVNGSTIVNRIPGSVDAGDSSERHNGQCFKGKRTTTIDHTRLCPQDSVQLVYSCNHTPPNCPPRNCPPQTRPAGNLHRNYWPTNMLLLMVY